jgi:hypothetical protein
MLVTPAGGVKVPDTVNFSLTAHAGSARKVISPHGMRKTAGSGNGKWRRVFMDQ